MVAGLEKNVLWVLLNNKELWLDRMPELLHAEMPTTLPRQRFLLVVNYSVGEWRGLSTVWNGSSGTKSGLINFQLVDKPTALVAYVLLSRMFFIFIFFIDVNLGENKQDILKLFWHSLFIRMWEFWFRDSCSYSSSLSSCAAADIHIQRNCFQNTFCWRTALHCVQKIQISTRDFQVTRKKLQISAMDSQVT